jgi:hypothetical protein
MAREELARIKPADKIDRPHPKYEEKSARLDGTAEPNAFEEPGGTPKRVPASSGGSGGDSDPSRM